MEIVVVCTEFSNAVYVDGQLRDQGDTDFLNAETINNIIPRLFPNVTVRLAGGENEQVLQDRVDGGNWPQQLEALSPMLKYFN